MHKFNISLFIMTLFISLGHSHLAQASSDFEGIWGQSQLLEQADLYRELYAEAQLIAEDLNSGRGQYNLIYKNQSGGSSHQALVIRTSDQKVMGIWTPPNHATYLLGEIFAFNLARLFERGDLSTPAIRMTLSGAGLLAAKQALMTTSQSKDRMCNRAHFLSYIEANPQYIVGVYKPFKNNHKPADVPELVDRNKGQFRLNLDHKLVQMIQTQGVQPSSQTVVYLNKKKKDYQFSQSRENGDGVTSILTVGEAIESDLAKQLSFMSLIDALNAQRDRFGIYGSNMQVMLNQDQKTYMISLIDNGGVAEVAQAKSLLYFIGKANGAGVSRFERDIFAKVLALDDFLSQRTQSFLEYKSIQDLKIALGYEETPNQTFLMKDPVQDPSSRCTFNHSFLFRSYKDQWDKKWLAFNSAVKQVANYMRQYKFNENAFFQQ